MEDQHSIHYVEQVDKARTLLTFLMVPVILGLGFALGSTPSSLSLAALFLLPLPLLYLRYLLEKELLIPLLARRWCYRVAKDIRERAAWEKENSQSRMNQLSQEINFPDRHCLAMWRELKPLG